MPSIENTASEHNAPSSFRRERYWFYNFVMTPFRDVDQRTNEDAIPRQPKKRNNR
jgi:hypothetical protein